MTSEDFANALADLRTRVDRLEAAGMRSAGSVVDAGLAEQLRAALTREGAEVGDSGPGSVVYAGAGPSDRGTIGWQMVRSWPELLGVNQAPLAACFAALANPVRIQIMCELIAGPLSTGELAQRLDQPSAGQLFHHLKELLGTGLIYQPERGTYRVRHAHIVPVLTALSCAIDLTPPDIEADPA
jgi:DNA-binding transcriptional ArsR family regulator